MTARIAGVNARCYEDDCITPVRPGSDWCEEHRCYCELCDTPLEDGEDYCDRHQAELGVRWAVELPEGHPALMGPVRLPLRRRG